MAEPYSMIVIGDGWRSRFLCRMAQAVPDRLRVNLVVGHHADRLEAIARDYGVPTSADADVRVQGEPWMDTLRCQCHLSRIGPTMVYERVTADYGSLWAGRQ